MIKTTSPTGFHITFNNGITVSVQWDSMNYCNNSLLGDMEASKASLGCANAEVAAIVKSESSEFITSYILTLMNVSDKDYDDVVGYLDANQVLDFMRYASILNEVDIFRNKQHKAREMERLVEKYKA